MINNMFELSRNEVVTAVNNYYHLGLLNDGKTEVRFTRDGKMILIKPVKNKRTIVARKNVL